MEEGEEADKEGMDVEPSGSGVFEMGLCGVPNCTNVKDKGKKVVNEKVVQA